MPAGEARGLTQLEKPNTPLGPKASPQGWLLMAEAELERAMLLPQASEKRGDVVGP